jgi:hypothetical protein
MLSNAALDAAESLCCSLVVGRLERCRPVGRLINEELLGK